MVRPHLHKLQVAWLIQRRYERIMWVPVLIAFIVATGVGGHHFSNPPPAEPATARSVLSFVSTLAGFVITYSPIASDYTIYYRPDTPRCVSSHRCVHLHWDCSCALQL